VADEARDEVLGLLVEVERAALEAGAASADAVPLQALLDDVRAAAAGLGEAEVVVGRDVERAGARAGRTERLVVVLRGAVEESDRAAGDAGDRLRETVVDAGLEPAGVE
jgi:hypothetical protein